MRCIVPGHLYELYSYEGKSAPQTVHFIKKEKDDSGNLKTDMDGTTNEEVLAMLIDRMKFLQAASSCRENAIVITKLEEALMWLEKRTFDRTCRGVEGTPKP